MVAQRRCISEWVQFQMSLRGSWADYGSRQQATDIGCGPPCGELGGRFTGPSLTNSSAPVSQPTAGGVTAPCSPFVGWQASYFSQSCFSFLQDAQTQLLFPGKREPRARETVVARG